MKNILSGIFLLMVIIVFHINGVTNEQFIDITMIVCALILFITGFFQKD